MSREQAAAFLGYSVRTLNNLAVLRQGPPYYSSGKKVWYLQSEILAWMKSLRQGGSATCSTHIPSADRLLDAAARNKS